MEHEVLLICNGTIPPHSELRSLAEKSKLIVAADGGANQAVEAGVFPHVVVGDLDSITEHTKSKLSQTRLVKVQNQNFCDLEKALDFILGQEYRDVLVVGMEGKRFDFTLSNFSVIWRYVARLDLKFCGQGWKAYPIKEKQVFHEAVGTTVSLVPFGICEGITLSGLKYPLENGSLHVGQTAVSNEVASSPFQVELKSGKLMMIVSYHS